MGKVGEGREGVDEILIDGQGGEKAKKAFVSWPQADGGWYRGVFWQGIFLTKEGFGEKMYCASLIRAYGIQKIRVFPSAQVEGKEMEHTGASSVGGSG